MKRTESAKSELPWYDVRSYPIAVVGKVERMVVQS